MSSADNQIRMDGKVAIVTGANQGIGLGIAQAFAQAGAAVVMGGRNEERNATAVKAIVATGGKAVAVRCDVGNESDVAALVTHAMDRHGRIDVAVANAGGVESGLSPLENMTTGEWRQTLAVNLDGVFFLYRDSLKHMLPAGRGGSLIAISSLAAIRTSPAMHYAAAKGGVNALTTALSDKVGPNGIRVNSIMPGYVKTPASAQSLSNEKVMAGLMKRIPMRRVGEPLDVAHLALFLASDLSTFITGHDFVVDGGMSRT